MYKGFNEEGMEAEYQRQNNSLKQRIIQLEAQTQQKDVRQGQLVKKLDRMAQSQHLIEKQFMTYQQQVKNQAVNLQQCIQQRNSCIVTLRSQLSMVQESNQNLYDLLRRSNEKTTQLMRQLTLKNRFIKEYIQNQHDISE